MLALNGILTKEQADMGMSLKEDAHLVYLLKDRELLSAFNAKMVTFTMIQKEAHNHECWLKSGIEVYK